ncbi:SMI1/KNR4 family protein [Paenibacillus sp. 7516]|uniref:SMI1/KNR4 family protein n=1 Tax=Paenibacillus sp. 7516 TaxID=2022549 RepID=UPI000BA5AF80|nr:SMI1/KNR4 family protein [Paenibacillus sp. 7516]PAF30470.1 SMI1/KNR4 family protein [Paenibacillus sp. 7516]
MWNDVFEKEWEKRPGAKREELHVFLQTWNDALSVQELQEIRARQKNPFPKSSPFYEQYTPLDPSSWSFPKRPLPDSHAHLLTYSNGGEFQNGERIFQFHGTPDFREMNLAYEFAEYMPGSVSFAMDGSGNHYIFDMREASRNGEYPILFAHSGNLGYEDCVHVADSLPELCRGTDEIE